MAADSRIGDDGDRLELSAVAGRGNGWSVEVRRSRARRRGSCRSRGWPATRAWPAFAPDGEQVAFAWSGEKFDNTDIYVTLVGSTGVRRLTTDPADDYAPSWSPDGRRIAFLRRTGTCRSHSRDVGTGWARFADQRISSGRDRSECAQGVNITWSPDGRYVAAGRDPARCERRFRRPLSDSNRRRGASRDHAAEGSHVSFLARFFAGRSPHRVRVVRHGRADCINVDAGQMCGRRR